MPELDVTPPLYYVIGRKTDPELIEAVIRITPCPTAVVTRYEDMSLAQKYSETVLMNADAAQVATETRRPVIVIGDGEKIEEVYKGSD